MVDTIKEFEKKLALTFCNDGALLTKALTHSSGAQENQADSNERMEFLGDAILGTVISERLFNDYPTWSEGELTRAKAALVNEPALAAAARRIKLGEVLILSRGEDQSGGRNRPSILCGAFEALIAAVYLDCGMEAARDFILKWLAEPIEAISRGEYHRDYKTLLQELLQEEHRALPNYRVIEETGPDHDKTFVVEVSLGKNILGVGSGKSKKEAERSAAKHALEKQVEVEEPGETE